MKVLVYISFALAIAFMLAMDVVMWTEHVLYGIGGLIGMLGFFVAYSISGDMIIAPRDFWRFSSWQVFKKKMGYAFGVYLVVTLVAAGVLASIFG